MKPLRGKLGIPEAPAMPCAKYDLPKEMLQANGEVKHLTPEERWNYFHKTCKKRNKAKQAQNKNTPLQAEPSSGGGAHFATSARLAMSQELIDLNAFYDKYGDTKAKLGNHTIKEDDPLYWPSE